MPADGTVVDLGAGTGQFALAAAERFGRVVAVDVSPVMLRRLQGTTGFEIVSVEYVGAAFGAYTCLRR